MFRNLFSGALFGGAAVYFDAHVTTGLLGFENPYAIFALLVMWAMAVVGLATSRDRWTLVPIIVGVPIGVYAVNLFRVQQFGEPSLLAGIGL